MSRGKQSTDRSKQGFHSVHFTNAFIESSLKEGLEYMKEHKLWEPLKSKIRNLKSKGWHYENYFGFKLNNYKLYEVIRENAIFFEFMIYNSPSDILTEQFSCPLIYSQFMENINKRKEDIAKSKRKMKRKKFRNHILNPQKQKVPSYPKSKLIPAGFSKKKPKNGLYLKRDGMFFVDQKELKEMPYMKICEQVGIDPNLNFNVDTTDEEDHEMDKKEHETTPPAKNVNDRLKKHCKSDVSPINIHQINETHQNDTINETHKNIFSMQAETKASGNVNIYQDTKMGTQKMSAEIQIRHYKSRIEQLQKDLKTAKFAVTVQANEIKQLKNQIKNKKNKGKKIRKVK